jgi:hypothetical protein
VLLLPAAGLQVDMPPTSTASASAAQLPPAGHNNAPSSGGGSGSSSGGSAAGRVLTDFPRLMTCQVRFSAACQRLFLKQGQQLTEEQHQVLLFADLLEQVKQGFQPSPAHAQLLRGHWQFETEALQRQLAALRRIKGAEVQVDLVEQTLAFRAGLGGGWDSDKERGDSGSFVEAGLGVLLLALAAAICAACWGR